MRIFIGIIGLLATVSGFAVEPGEDPLLPAGREWIANQTAAWRGSLTKQQRVWSAVRADKKSRSVEIAATGAGVAEAGLLEFLLVSDKGKAYESVAVTTALPSDVVKALAFIGMPEGRPINYGKRHFWPRGERVTVQVVLVDAEGKGSEPIDATRLVSHRERKDKASQFVFVGSSQPDETSNSPLVDATGDIMSLYSNPFAVFDVHLRTPQGEHYGATTVAAKGAMDRSQRLLFVIRPEYGEDKQRVRDVSLTVAANEAKDALTFAFREMPDGDRVGDLDLPEVLARLQKLIEAGHDPFVQVGFDPATPLALAAEFGKLLDAAAGQSLLRVEPLEGEPYYQALLPDPAWLDRSKRPGQPLEVHAKKTDDGWSGKLVRPEFMRADTGWEVKISEEPFASIADLVKKVADEEENQALFYYLPESGTYGDLKALYALFGEKWPTQYVFLYGEK